MREFLQRTDANERNASFAVSKPRPISRFVSSPGNPLLQLQRSIGNRALQRLLTPMSPATGDRVHRQATQAPAQAPAQAPDHTAAPGGWGSKKWPLFENDWNAFYQLAVQGLAGTSKPEKIPDLAAMIADDSMALCLKHGDQMHCAKDAAPNKDGRSAMDVALPWGDKGLWGETFRSALQSTTPGVDGPKTADAAVQKAAAIADQAVRGMLGDDLWKIYMQCKASGASSSPKQSPPKQAPAGH